MTRAEAKERIVKLREEINRYRYEYHVLDQLSISEAALDTLKHELYKLEQEHPDLITPDSPTQRVAGEPAPGFKKVPHATPMLSIEDAFSRQEMDEWLTRIKKIEPGASFDFFAELKMDGVAVSLIYQDGVLVEGSTRGDGRVGEEVTRNLRTIEAIPLRLRTPSSSPFVRGRVEIRGEVFMTKKQLADLNKKLQKRGEALLANPRNASAGSIRQLDPKIAAERGLSFYGYAMMTEFDLKTHQQAHECIAELGVPQNPLNRHCKSLDEVENYFDEIGKKRERLPYWTDGIVVNVNNNKLFNRLGVVGKTARGSIAWKFPAEQGTTIVRDIIVSVGRTGALTPVAVMDPVSLVGTTVTRASLHNQDEIERLGLRIGDTVIVEKAGDVIPKVIQVLPKLRTGKEKVFHMPKKCPMCGSPVERREGEVATVCTNRHCFAQELASILHFVSRTAFDIRGLGDKIAEQLLQKGLVHEPADLFRLKAGDFLTLEGFAEVSSKKLEAEIQAHHQISLERFIYALGIRHVGERTAVDLVRGFGSIEKLRQVSKEELMSVEGVGEIVADAIVHYFKQPHVQKQLDHLLEVVQVASAPKQKEGPFAGTLWVITGSLEAMGREEAKEKIRALGGEVSESVSKKTSYVIVGVDPGSKYEKAQKLGVTILDEKAFLKKIKS